MKKLCGYKIKRGRGIGWLNNNSCEMLQDNPLAKKDRRFREGNILCCFNALQMLGIIDYATKEVVWAWPRNKGIIQSPHAPVMLDNGNILIFDNGAERGWSRVIELDPLAKKIVWEYHGEPKESFYSPTMSNAERLPNGNTLICEGAKNRIFEITPRGEIVWDFISTFNKTAGTECIYRAFRYSPEYVKPLLEQIDKLQKTQEEKL
ncbi:MAG: arylsulfotransferase family protein [Candidatus Omnitrophica bacterium]|nr:arylsulfotransferase family protein [Candidatus Omnitrophota bacterium]